MKEKERKIDISVNVTITDDGKSDYTPGPFCRLPWGWACIISTIFFILDVKYGNDVFGILPNEKIGTVLLGTMFVTYIFFIAKLVDRHSKEGGSSVGCDYPYFGF